MCVRRIENRRFQETPISRFGLRFQHAAGRPCHCYGMKRDKFSWSSCTSGTILPDRRFQDDKNLSRLSYHAGINLGVVMSVFKQLESLETGQSMDLSGVIDQMPWNQDGLLPAIAQQFDTKEVLMMAWMNRDALLETLETGRVCYWSRSRQQYWRKGESSGQVQVLKEMRLDCDGDTILLLVDQTGPACHTGRRDCFYNKIDGDQLVVDKAPIMSKEELYGK